MIELHVSSLHVCPNANLVGMRTDAKISRNENSTPHQLGLSLNPRQCKKLACRCGLKSCQCDFEPCRGKDYSVARSLACSLACLLLHSRTAASSSGRNKFRETVLSFLHLDQSTCAADVKLQDSPGHRHSLKKRSTKDLQKLPKWRKVKSLHRFQLGLLLKSSSRFQPGNRSSRYGLIRFPWQFLFSDTVLFDST